jgi:hypothetical protein
MLNRQDRHGREETARTPRGLRPNLGVLGGIVLLGALGGSARAEDPVPTIRVLLQDGAKSVTVECRGALDLKTPKASKPLLQFGRVTPTRIDLAVPEAVRAGVIEVDPARSLVDDRVARAVALRVEEIDALAGLSESGRGEQQAREDNRLHDQSRAERTARVPRDDGPRGNAENPAADGAASAPARPRDAVTGPQVRKDGRACCPVEFVPAAA